MLFLTNQECQIEFSSSFKLAMPMLYSISIMHMKVLSQLNHLHEPARYWWITVQLFVTKAHTFSFKSWLMWKSWLEQIISSTEYRPLTERSAFRDWRTSEALSALQSEARMYKQTKAHEKPKIPNTIVKRFELVIDGIFTYRKVCHWPKARWKFQ